MAQIRGKLGQTQRLISLTSLLLILMLTVACRSIPNYQESDGPLFTENYAEHPPNFSGEVKVVTWNIKFSTEIEAATTTLKEAPPLKRADIILLQEMDETGVEAIARSLNYNYIYFPASIHSHHNKNFGNAILSLWPITHPAKLLLPHPNPKNNQARIAVKAQVTASDKDIVVYSLHTETLWLSQAKRNEQIASLVKDLAETASYVIVGGDFNTLTTQSITELESRFKLVGLERVSNDSGPTMYSGPVGFTADHIFAGGVSVLETGVWTATEASDHLPLWVRLQLDEGR